MSELTELRTSDDRLPGEFDPDFGLDCSFVLDNAGALALDALEPAERRRIERHLTWCPACALHVVETRRAIALFPYLSPMVEPPVGAKRRLFDAIETAERPALKTTVLPSATLTIPASAPALAPLPAGWGEDDAIRAKPAGRKRRSGWEMALAPLAAVPLVLALTIVGGWALRTHEQMRDQTAELQLLRSENADLENQVAAFTSNSSDNVIQRFTLASNESMTGGGPSGSINAVANQPKATLEVWKLGANAHGYEVVVESHDGTAHIAGTFQVDEHGRARLELDLSRPLETYRSVHIQPNQGSDRSVSADWLGQNDILWTDIAGALGARTGTEAYATGN